MPKTKAKMSFVLVFAYYKERLNALLQLCALWEQTDSSALGACRSGLGGSWQLTTIILTTSKCDLTRQNWW